MIKEEFKNLERQLQFTEAEYNQYKERIDQISSPQYTAELKERIVTLTHKIKKLEKSTKKMETNQKKKDKAILKKEEIEPELSHDVTVLSAEAANLDQKLKEIDAKIEKQAGSLQEQSAKLATIKDQWRKIADEATSVGIDPFSAVASATSGSSKRGVAGTYDEFVGKKVALEKTVNLVKTRYTVTLGEYTQKKMGLQAQVTSMAESVQKKNEYDFFFCIS